MREFPVPGPLPLRIELLGVVEGIEIGAARKRQRGQGEEEEQGSQTHGDT